MIEAVNFQTYNNDNLTMQEEEKGISNLVYLFMNIIYL